MKKKFSFLSFLNRYKAYILVILMLAVFTPLVMTGVIDRRTPFVNPNLLIQIA